MISSSLSLVPIYARLMEGLKHRGFPSCTLWHTDSDEHPTSARLEFTSLTVLSSGPTSMCIAGKDETWLTKPFSTVLFDPELYHRSGHKPTTM